MIKKEYLDKITINFRASIIDAIQLLEQNSLQILIVVKSKNFFLGTLTDGDIRRSLLKGVDLKASIKNVYNKNSFFLNKKIKKDELDNLFIKNKIHQIPLLDKNGKLVDIYLSKYLQGFKKYKTPVIIMAGGLGKRLGSLTKNCPKPMLPVNGKPILEHLITKLKNSGFENIFISVNYLKDKIINYFKDGKKFGVKITYINESKPLGTAGSLKNIENILTTKYFVVMNGDVISSIDIINFISFHNRNQSFASMAVRNYEIKNNFGVVKTKGIEIVNLLEKPIIKNYINAGIYILHHSILDLIDKNERLEMPELFMKIKKNKMKIIAYPIHEEWMDIGNYDDYNSLLTR